MIRGDAGNLAQREALMKALDETPDSNAILEWNPILGPYEFIYDDRVLECGHSLYDFLSTGLAAMHN